MFHFVAMTEKTMAEGLAKLFRDNVWKLHGLPESVISDRGPQFAAGLTKELNKNVGDRNKVIDGILPIDGWSDRKDKSGAGAIFENVCQL